MCTAHVYSFISSRKSESMCTCVVYAVRIKSSSVWTVNARWYCLYCPKTISPNKQNTFESCAFCRNRRLLHTIESIVVYEEERESIWYNFHSNRLWSLNLLNRAHANSDRLFDLNSFVAIWTELDMSQSLRGLFLPMLYAGMLLLVDNHYVFLIYTRNT